MTNGVTRLKELLLDDERDRLDRVGTEVSQMSQRLRELEEVTREAQQAQADTLRRIEDVFERAGTQERFQTSVTEVLHRALIDAEVQRHEQMSRAVAPLVVGTIKTELRNSQDEMVEALYPITGQLVKRYVASAMKELAENINRRLEQNPVSLRLRSLATGRPVSELAMASTQDLKVEEIYLIRRGSGELIARWPEGKPLSNRDVHVSGVLSAINDFATHAFQADGGEVRSFTANDFKIVLRASPLYLIAAKCRGTANEAAQRIFDEEFIEFLQTSALRKAPGDQHALAPQAHSGLNALASNVENRVATAYEESNSSSSGFGVLKILALLILLPLLAWFGWTLYTSAEKAYVARIADQTLLGFDSLKGYPASADTGYRGRTVVLKGLVPNETIRTQVVSAMRAAVPSWSNVVASELKAIPAVTTHAPAQPDLSSFDRKLAAFKRDFEARSTRQSLSHAAERLSATSKALQAVLRKLAGVQTPPLLKNVSGNDLAQAARTADKLRTRLATLQATLAVADLKPEALTRTQRELATLLNDLRPLDAALAKSVGREASPTRAQSAPDTSRTGEPGATSASAQNVAIVAGRIASLATTLEQLGRIELPKPQPTPAAAAASATPREKVINWTKNFAIFFSDGTTFRDPAKVDEQLDQLARLMKASGDLVRIVGYTDERGGSTRNSTLAASRAQAVLNELLSRGVPANQLVAVGRASLRDLSPRDGRGSPNRRVEFEVGYIGEAAIDPGVANRPTDR